MQDVPSRQSTLWRGVYTVVGERSRFFYLASFVFVAFLASLRILLIDYSVYHETAKRDVTALLEQESFPPREQAHHVVAAAVLSVHEAYRAANPEITVPEESEVAKRLHAAFGALTELLVLQSPDDAAIDEAIRKSYKALALEDDGTPFDHWQKEIAGRFAVYFDLMEKQPKKALLNMQESARSARDRGSEDKTFEDHEAFSDAEIVACQADCNQRTRHEKAFGSAGCDRPAVNPHTSLLVASRENECVSRLPFAGFPAESDGQQAECLKECECENCRPIYSRRLLQSNAVSLLMESILGALGGLTEDSRLRWESSQLVQAYFMAPDSLLRYASVIPRDAYFAFGPARLWGASALIDQPILKHDRLREPYRSHFNSARRISGLIAAFANTVPSTPYIDLGDNGLVRTNCTPAVRADETLLGLLCTDHTVPVFPGLLSTSEDIRTEENHESLSAVAADEEGAEPSTEPPHKPEHGAELRPRLPSKNQLLSATILTIDPSAECPNKVAPIVLRGLSTDQSEYKSLLKQSMLTHAVDGRLISDICQRIETQQDRFFRSVQPFDSVTEDAGRMFLVPVGRDGEISNPARMRYLALLINPTPPSPPRATLIICVMLLSILGLTVSLRIYVDISSRRWSREQAILRNLQVGVLDVAENTFIDAANDRAEELLETWLPTMGARHDTAKPRDFTEFVHPLFLRRSKKLDRLFPLEVEQLSRLRDDGLAFPFYARRRRAEDDDCEKFTPAELEGKVQAIEELCRRAKNEAGAESSAGERKELAERVHNVKRLWLRVKGNPLFNPPSSQHGRSRTFAVIHTVSKHTALELEREFWKTVAQQGAMS